MEQPISKCSGRVIEVQKTPAYLPNKFQTLAGTDIPLSMFLDLRKYPRLDEGASPDHHAIDTATFHAFPVALRRIGIAASEDRDRRHFRQGTLSKSRRMMEREMNRTSFVGFTSPHGFNAFPDVIPISQFGVPLLTSPAVELNCS